VALSDLRARWIVLGEGVQDQNFVYHWLRERGVARGKITKLQLPAGKRAGEQYVRMHYGSEVKQFRKRAGHLKLVLVVVSDADTGTVEARVQGLDDQVQRRADERILLMIPRRNIETWIRYLCGAPVDEVTNYKPKEPDAEACRAAAVKLAATRSAPDDAPDSLRRFFQELRRVD
jgi:hypothetical protein